VSSGPEGWAQPQGGKPIFDDVVFSGASPIRRTPVTGGAHRLLMWDGGSVIQRPFLATARSQAPQFYEFTWDQDGAVEAEWRIVERARALGDRVDLIPMLTESEVFLCAAGANTFTLTRPTAKSASTSFNSTTFPNAALLDGVAQTIVETGTPATTEIDIQTSTVITPSDITAGQILEIIYYPAYSVLVPRTEASLLAFNDLRRPVVALEAA
jgi:hypothetical protein